MPPGPHWPPLASLKPQYAFTAEDATGAWLDGARTYTLTLPAGIPVKTFWAIDIYDTQTRSLLQTGSPYPSINSRFSDVHAEDNGDTIITFVPAPPSHPGANWLQTIPGKSWFPHPAPVRPAPALARPNLATRRNPAQLTAQPPRPARPHRTALVALTRRRSPRSWGQNR
jgi:hypothetical protein